MFKNGISTGLMLWLFFLVAFALLGYAIPFSIIVGAIGGLSGGAIVTGWHSKDTPPVQQSSEAHEDNPPETIPRLGIVAAQRQRKIREKRTPKGKVFAMQRLRTRLRRSLRRR